MFSKQFKLYDERVIHVANGTDHFNRLVCRSLAMRFGLVAQFPFDNG
jgi:hypothetical protein